MDSLWSKSSQFIYVAVPNLAGAMATLPPLLSGKSHEGRVDR